jgi:CBS domain containing-hemolysin-like protein
LDEGSLSSLLALIVLIALHGGVELGYAALTNVRRAPLKTRSEAGDKQARRILRLSDDLARLSVTRQVFLMIVRFAIVAIATVRLADPLIRAEDAAGIFLIPELGYLAVLLPTALLSLDQPVPEPEPDADPRERQRGNGQSRHRRRDHDAGGRGAAGRDN